MRTEFPAALALIHLVSEQVMQNLLPLMALQPVQVYQIVSGEMRQMQFHSNIEKAAGLAGIDAEFHNEFVASGMPNETETQEKVAQCIQTARESRLEPLINLTGGTKLMSLGAYEAARSAHVSAFYFDSSHHVWRTVCGAELPEPDTRQVLRQMGVNTVLQAHGFNPADLRTEPVDEELLRIAGEMYRCIRSAPNETLTWAESVRETVMGDRNDIPKSKAKLDVVLNTPLPPVPPPAEQLARILVEARILQRRNGELFLNAPRERGAVKKNLHFITGTWFELWVVGRIRQKTDQYVDAKWSLRSLQDGASGRGETDIVALDTDKARLLVVSCKVELRGGQQLEHLESLRQRADALGGKYSRACLAVFQHKNPPTLKKRGEMLGVDVLVGSELEQAF